MNRQYVGARYVVKIYENSQNPLSAEWEQNINYESLTMVTYNYGTYVSKKPVPANIGNPADNGVYWTQTGFYNGQITSLQSQITALRENVEKTNVVTPEMYGAYGDGEHDDSSAINEALNNNKYVFFKNKTYLVHSPIVIKGNVVFGNNAIIKTDAAINILTFADTYGANINNLILSGENVGINGIYSTMGLGNCVIRDVICTGFTNDGIYLENCWQCALYNISAYYNGNVGLEMKLGYNTIVNRVNCSWNKIGIKLFGNNSGSINCADVSYNTEKGIILTYVNDYTIDGIYSEDSSEYPCPSIVSFEGARCFNCEVKNLHLSSNINGTYYIDFNSAEDYSSIILKNIRINVANDNQKLVRLGSSSATHTNVLLENDIAIFNEDLHTAPTINGYGTIHTVNANGDSIKTYSNDSVSSTFKYSNGTGFDEYNFLPIQTDRARVGYDTYVLTGASESAIITNKASLFKGIVRVTTRKGTASYYIDYTGGNTTNVVCVNSDINYFGADKINIIVSSETIFLYFPAAYQDTGDVAIIETICQNNSSMIG